MPDSTPYINSLQMDPSTTTRKSHAQDQLVAVTALYDAGHTQALILNSFAKPVEKSESQLFATAYPRDVEVNN